jgi:hypothetical protein
MFGPGLKHSVAFSKIRQIRGCPNSNFAKFWNLNSKFLKKISKICKKKTRSNSMRTG